MALGLLSLYLTAFIVGTFYLRQLVPYRIWRLIHYATFGAFALALVHGVGAGTDTAAGWPPYPYAATGLIAFNLLVYRVLKGSARPGRVIGSVRPKPAHEA
jgi:methionine sulfoxide reductase heme-binding subunit